VLEFLLGDMAEGWMAEVVGQCRRFNDVRVNPAGCGQVIRVRGANDLLGETTRT